MTERLKLRIIVFQRLRKQERKNDHFRVDIFVKCGRSQPRYPPLLSHQSLNKPSSKARVIPVSTLHRKAFFDLAETIGTTSPLMYCDPAVISSNAKEVIGGKTKSTNYDCILSTLSGKVS